MQRVSEITDETTPVRQIDVVRAGFCCGLCHAVILTLERSGGMNQQFHAELAQGLWQLRSGQVYRNTLGTVAQFARQRSGALQAAPTHQQLYVRIAGQGAANTRTKIPVAP